MPAPAARTEREAAPVAPAIAPEHPLPPHLVLLRAEEQAELLRAELAGDDERPARPPPRVEATLRDILYWWRTRQAEFIARYESAVFGGPLGLAEVGLGRDAAARRDWLRLWAAALVAPEAAPVGPDAAWLELLAEPPPPTEEWPVRYALVIHAILGSPQAARWSEHGGTLCAFGRWLPEAVPELIGAIQNARAPMPLLLPQHAPGAASGTEPRPSLLPAHATPFLTRELLRRSFAVNPALHAQAFVVTPAVRALLERFGARGFGHGPLADSAAAHGFLSYVVGPADATFDGAFDVPFTCLLEDPEATAELLEA